MSSLINNQAGANLYTQGFGSRPENVEIPHLDVRDPAATDVNYPIGKRWVNTTGGSEWSLVQKSAVNSVVSSTWVGLGGGSAGVDTINLLLPTAGNMTIAGTANQIGIANAGSTVTLSLIGPYTPATYTAHGVLIGNGNSSITAAAVGASGQVLVGSNGNDPVFATLGTSTGISYSSGHGSLSINIQSGGFAVVPVAGASQAMAVQTTYIANDNALTTFTLPAVAFVGDVIRIVGSSLNTGGWQVTYGAGQIIWGPGGSSTVTTGNAASAAAAAQAMEIVCTIQSTTWGIVSNSGTITLT